MLMLPYTERLMLPAAPFSFEVESLELIGNTNTGKVHHPGCRALGMMLPEHKVTTDGTGYSPCGWCHAAGPEGGEVVLDEFIDEDPEDVVVCRDPEILKLFKDFTCDCGSLKGVVKMYPHGSGYRLKGKIGKYWIYLECSSCHHQTSLRHVLNARRMVNSGGGVGCGCV